ncbi:MAG TPA: hypothetical protein VF042_10500 [Gemmatimonadaceae bacterium]
MPRLRVGIVRYGPIQKEISRVIGTRPPVICRVARGRITLIFKQVGATTWSDSEKFNQAFRAAELARAVLDADTRRLVRRKSKRAVVVIYEDRMMTHGCDVTARWQCIVPST